MQIIGINYVFVLEKRVKHHFFRNLAYFFKTVTFKTRSRSQNLIQIFSMSKCCIHANFGWNQSIRSGDIGHNITFWTKFSIFFQQWPSKLSQGHRISFRFSACPSVAIMQILVEIKVSGDIGLTFWSFFFQHTFKTGHNSDFKTFWTKFSIFLAAVTFKTRSRSQNLIQIFNMSKCCIHANFG